MSNQVATAPEQHSAAARAASVLFGVGAAAVVAGGWANRQRDYLSPEFGLGYTLGIVGAVMMLTLLVYSARKNFRFMRTWGRVRPWFQLHQVLGIVGPVCILFHANFSLGSTNSNVALGCMLLIVTSGFVGRYLHGKIHGSLRWRQQLLAECRQQCMGPDGEFAGPWAHAHRVRERILRFETRALEEVRGLGRRVLHVAPLGLQARWARLLIARDLRRYAALKPGCSPRAMAAFVARYLAAVRSVAELGVYERLFALWHLLHVPLFVVLFLSAVVHIIAVHAY